MQRLENDHQEHVLQQAAAEDRITDPGVVSDRPQRIAGPHAALEPLPILRVCQAIAAFRFLDRDGGRYRPQ